MDDKRNMKCWTKFKCCANKATKWCNCLKNTSDHQHFNGKLEDVFVESIKSKDLIKEHLNLVKYNRLFHLLQWIDLKWSKLWGLVNRCYTWVSLSMFVKKKTLPRKITPHQSSDKMLLLPCKSWRLIDKFIMRYEVFYFKLHMKTYTCQCSKNINYVYFYWIGNHNINELNNKFINIFFIDHFAYFMLIRSSLIFPTWFCTWTNKFSQYLSSWLFFSARLFHDLSMSLKSQSFHYSQFEQMLQTIG